MFDGAGVKCTLCPTRYVSGMQTSIIKMDCSELLISCVVFCGRNAALGKEKKLKEFDNLHFLNYS